MKVCSKCKKRKNVEEFWLKQTHCIDCQKKRLKECSLSNRGRALRKLQCKRYRDRQPLEVRKWQRDKDNRRIFLRHGILRIRELVARLISASGGHWDRRARTFLDTEHAAYEAKLNPQVTA